MPIIATPPQHASTSASPQSWQVALPQRQERHADPGRALFDQCPYPGHDRHAFHTALSAGILVDSRRGRRSSRTSRRQRLALQQTGGRKSLGARVIAVADVFKTLTATDRPYKTGKSTDEALAIMAGMARRRHLDPGPVRSVRARRHSSKIRGRSRRYSGCTECINHKAVFINLSSQCHSPDLWLPKQHRRMSA